MITRRSIICAMPLLASPLSNVRGQTPRTFGCCVPGAAANEYFASSKGAQRLTRDMIDMKKHSASRELDYAFAQTLGMLCEHFAVMPAFAYYQEKQDEGFNAKATQEIIIDRTDGTVLYGLNMLTKQLAGNYGDYGIMAVAAHEFGHIVAMKRGFNDKLTPDLTKPYRSEQFADFMSGLFAGYRKNERSTFQAQNFAMAMHDLGTLTRETHGTREERGQAVAIGFTVAQDKALTFDGAVQKGIDFAMARV